MKAMQMLDAPFSVEARAYMARHDLPPDSFHQVRGELVRKAYMKEIEPYSHLLTEFAKLSTPIFILNNDGCVERSADQMPNSQTQEAVDQLHARIRDIKARYDRMF